MIKLNKSEEELLSILKDKYEKSGTNDYKVELNLNDLPAYLIPNIKDLSEELKRAGHITQVYFFIGGNCPYVITPSLLSYFDDKDKIKANTNNQNTYNVGSINADESNIVLGDVVKSTLDMVNSKDKITEEVVLKNNESKSRADISLSRIVAICTIIGVIAAIIFGIIELLN